MNRGAIRGGAPGTSRTPSGSEENDFTSNNAPLPTSPGDEREAAAARAVPTDLHFLPPWMMATMLYPGAAAYGGRETPPIVSSPLMSPPRMNAHQTASEADGEAPSIISSTPSASSPAKTPRAYQSDIADKCERENCLVVLPTGMCIGGGCMSVHAYLHRRNEE